ncbi:MAG: hypothetical protein ACT4QA_03135 [Panacagrimonas sp.]
MAAATEDKPASPRRAWGGGINLLRALVVNLSIVALALAIYYFGVLTQQQRYQNERSFRALGELTTRIDNTLATIDSLFLAVSGTEVPLAIPGLVQKKDQTPCESSGTPAQFIIDLKESAPILRATRCNAGGLSFRLPLSDLLDPGEPLAEFDQVAILADSGEVLALAADRHARKGSSTVHQEILDPQELAGLSDLLIEAQRELWKTDRAGAGDKAAAPLPDSLRTARAGRAPGAEVTTRVGLGDRTYRAFMAPYRPQFALGTVAVGAAAPANQALYIVGFKRESAFSAATADLGPEFNWYLLLLSVGGFALAPLLRLIFIEPHDAITPTHERVVLASWMFLPALLSLAGLSLIAGHALSDWADAGAKRYAEALDDEIEGELLGVLAALDRYAPLYRSKGPDPAPTAGGSGYRMQGCDDKDSPSRRPSVRRQYVQMLPEDPSAAMPAIKTLLKLDADGVIRRSNLTWFDCVQRPQPTSDVSARAYFSVHAAGEAWTRPSMHAGRFGAGVSKANPSPDGGYVAQRLFNRLRGDKLLQVSIPWHSDAAGTTLDGVIATDTAMFPLTAPVHPMGYRFAIFDEATGTVIFHSNDSRSLVENFYTESERPSTLLHAIAARRGGDYDISYRGRAHRLHYRPLDYAPWGVAVLLPDEQRGDLILRTGLTTLATYVAAVLAAGLVVGVLMMPGRRHLAWSWPQWRLRRAYPFLLLLLGTSMTAQAALFLTSDGAILSIGLLLSAVSIFASASAVLRPALHRGWVVHWRFVLVILCDLALAVLLLGLAQGACALWGAIAILCHALLSTGAWGVRGAETTPDGGADSWLVDSPVRLCLPDGWQPDSIRSTKILYALCITALAVQLYVIPMAGFYVRTLDLQIEADAHAGLVSAAADFKRREQTIQQDLVRYVRDPNERRQRFPSARTIATDGAPPGFRISQHGWELALWPEFTARTDAATPVHPEREPIRFLWHRLALLDPDIGYLARLMQAPYDDAQRWTFDRSGDVLSLKIPDADGVAGVRLALALPSARQPLLLTRPQTPGDEDRALEWTVLILGLLLLGGTTYVGLLLLVTRRLLGIRLLRPPSPIGSGRSGSAHLPRHFMLTGAPEPAQQRAALLKRLPRVRLAGEIDLAADTLDPVTPWAGNWLLRGFDVAVLDPQRRLAVLELIERAQRSAGARLYLVTMVDPLYRLVTPSAYPDATLSPLNEQERVRWCDALSGFRKRFAVTAGTLQGPTGAGREDLRREIEAECPPQWSRFKSYRRLLLKQLDQGWLVSAVDVRYALLTQARAHLQRLWLNCSTHERLTLWHLAHGRFLNPCEPGVIDLLIWKGLVAMRPYPTLVTETLARFVVAAEPPETFAEWSRQASRGIWQSLRVPLLIVLLLIGAWAAYSAGDTVELATAVLTGTLGFFALVARATSLVRGGGLLENSK